MYVLFKVMEIVKTYHGKEAEVVTCLNCFWIVVTNSVLFPFFSNYLFLKMMVV